MTKSYGTLKVATISILIVIGVIGVITTIVYASDPNDMHFVRDERISDANDYSNGAVKARRTEAAETRRNKDPNSVEAITADAGCEMYDIWLRDAAQCDLVPDGVIDMKDFAVMSKVWLMDIRIDRKRFKPVLTTKQAVPSQLDWDIIYKRLDDLKDTRDRARAIAELERIKLLWQESQERQVIPDGNEVEPTIIH